LAFIPLASVARSAASIAEQCSAPSSTTTQQVPHSQSPPQTVGHDHPWRRAAAMSDSPAATATTASTGRTRTAATTAASVAGQVPVDDVVHVDDPGLQAGEPVPRRGRAAEAGLLPGQVAEVLVHDRPA